MTALREELDAHISRHGPMRFDQFVNLALYHPTDGFYAHGGAGRRRDFVTSPELGPLFGAVIANAIDELWLRLGKPDPFVVVECGSGIGTLAKSIIDAVPKCSSALRYACVEVSAAQRRNAAAKLKLEEVAEFMGTTEVVDGDSEYAKGQGPRVAQLEALPSESFVGLIFANELLDNVASRLLRRDADGWQELFVDANGSEVLLVADDLAQDAANKLLPDAAEGQWIPLQEASSAWLRDALGRLERGELWLIDYARAATSEFAVIDREQWLRTYRGQARGSQPTNNAGEQDITCDVAIDQLATVRMPEEVMSQSAFLQHHGIVELASAAQKIWHERAAIGDLEALKAKSRVHEADALVDPDGLGDFTVMRWMK